MKLLIFTNTAEEANKLAKKLGGVPLTYDTHITTTQHIFDDLLSPYTDVVVCADIHVASTGYKVHPETIIMFTDSVDTLSAQYQQALARRKYKVVSKQDCDTAQRVRLDQRLLNDRDDPYNGQGVV